MKWPLALYLIHQSVREKGEKILQQQQVMQELLKGLQITTQELLQQ